MDKIKVKVYQNDHDTKCLVSNCQKFRTFAGSIGFYVVVCNMEIFLKDASIAHNSHQNEIDYKEKNNGSNNPLASKSFKERIV